MIIVGWILIALGAYLTALNYWALIANRRNRRQGIDRHHSFIPFLSGMLLASGFCILTGTWLAVLVVALDPAAWALVALPVALVCRRLRKPG